jgi:MFS family permease
LSDRFGRPKIILVGQGSILGLLLVLIGLFYFHLANWIALPFVALFGAGLLAFTPVALAELADAVPLNGRGVAMGLYSITVGAGTIFGPLAGGALISAYDARSGLVLLLDFGSAIMVATLFYEQIAKT